jgi:hypothetical protein
MSFYPFDQSIKSDSYFSNMAESDYMHLHLGESSHIQVNQGQRLVISRLLLLFWLFQDIVQVL